LSILPACLSTYLEKISLFSNRTTYLLKLHSAFTIIQALVEFDYYVYLGLCDSFILSFDFETISAIISFKSSPIDADFDHIYIAH